MSTLTTETTESNAKKVRACVLALLLAMAGTVSVMSLPGCNTTKGMGEDVEALGDSISDEAEDAQ